MFLVLITGPIVVKQEMEKGRREKKGKPLLKPLRASPHIGLR